MSKASSVVASVTQQSRQSSTHSRQFTFASVLTGTEKKTERKWIEGRNWKKITEEHKSSSPLHTPGRSFVRATIGFALTTDRRLQVDSTVLSALSAPHCWQPITTLLVAAQSAAQQCWINC